MARRARTRARSTRTRPRLEPWSETWCCPSSRSRASVASMEGRCCSAAGCSPEAGAPAAPPCAAHAAWPPWRRDAGVIQRRHGASTAGALKPRACLARACPSGQLRPAGSSCPLVSFFLIFCTVFELRVSGWSCSACCPSEAVPLSLFDFVWGPFKALSFSKPPPGVHAAACTSSAVGLCFPMCTLRLAHRQHL